MFRLRSRTLQNTTFSLLVFLNIFLCLHFNAPPSTPITAMASQINTISLFYSCISKAICKKIGGVEHCMTFWMTCKIHVYWENVLGRLLHHGLKWGTTKAPKAPLCMCFFVCLLTCLFVISHFWTEKPNLLKTWSLGLDSFYRFCFHCWWF